MDCNLAAPMEEVWVNDSADLMVEMMGQYLA
jgi:hypothetical protein